MTLVKSCAVISLVLSVGCASESVPAPNPEPANAYTELIISDHASVNGVYDPSIEYDENGTGWLSYSDVVLGKQGHVQTRIARSLDHGRSWAHVVDVNTVSPASARLPNGKKITGNWWNEVSSLVYDPDDKGKEWKLYWHRFLAKTPHKKETDRIFAFGWIASRHAPSPGGPWSDETALIGAGPFPLAPFKTAFKINELDPAFKDYVVLTEPGTLYHKGTLYMTLQAVRNPKVGKNKHDIIMIKSTDHGQNWTSVGVILKAEQAKDFGATWFAGSSLAIEDNRVFLMVCPEVAGAGTKAHRGTIIFEFENIEKGRLRQDTNTKPVVIKRLYPHLSMGGQSDYDAQNYNGGIIMPQFDLKNRPKVFRIYNSNETITGSD